MIDADGNSLFIRRFTMCNVHIIERLASKTFTVHEQIELSAFADANAYYYYVVVISICS